MARSMYDGGCESYTIVAVSQENVLRICVWIGIGLCVLSHMLYHLLDHLCSCRMQDWAVMHTFESADDLTGGGLQQVREVRNHFCSTPRCDGVSRGARQPAEEMAPHAITGHICKQSESMARSPARLCRPWNGLGLLSSVALC